MKYGVLILCVLLCSTACAQQRTTAGAKDPLNPQQIVNNYNTYGYIDGKRLDSIDAAFATFAPRTYDEVLFDYGQPARKVKEYALTDSTGIPLMFSNHSLSFLLNFFNYNKWTLYQTFGAADNTTHILKKE